MVQFSLISHAPVFMHVALGADEEISYPFSHEPITTFDTLLSTPVSAEENSVPTGERIVESQKLSWITQGLVSVHKPCVAVAATQMADAGEPLF